MGDDEGPLHGDPRRSWKLLPLLVLFKDARLVFKMDELGMEIIQIALPAALALAADPVASLIDTAFIGHLGPVELAAVGVSIAIFNQASKITIFPLVSITTSLVAEEDTVGNLHPHDSSALEDDPTVKNDPNLTSKLEEGIPLAELMTDVEQNSCKIQSVTSNNQNQKQKQKRRIPSASTAIVIGAFLGLAQALFLIFAAKTLLSFMGVKSDSPMLRPAYEYLALRSLGSPAVLLSLAAQGVFRGFKDTKTPLYATVAGDLSNIILDPILIFVCRLGVSGAAIAHVISQYLMALILLWRLMKKVELMPLSIKDLQFNRFLKNGFLLLARVIAVTFCVTLAASMAARLGSTPMAAFQICLQVWMTSSLLADGLAVAGQALLASAFAEKKYDKATSAASRVLQMGFVLGLGLAVVVGAGLRFGDTVFSKDPRVLSLIAVGIPFVAATQPINSLAFVYDGVNFGASDFAYSAYSMVAVAIASIACLFVLSKSNGYVGIWTALTIYMGLRTLAGFWRMGTGTGPWRFLRTATWS